MKKIFLAFMALVTLAACNETSLPQTNEMGSFKVSVEDVADDYITKASADFDVNTFNVEIT